MVKFLGQNEAILIDEDSYPLVASINTTAFDFKVVMNSKKARGIPSSPRIRKVWIPKKYLNYKNYMVVERGVSAVREKKK